MPIRPPVRRRALALTAALALAAGCASRVPPTEPSVAPAPPLPTDSAREARALLLLLADQRRYEPAALDALLDASPEIREALAVATGRIGDPRGRAVLQGLLVDSEAAVRRAAAFAAGELGVIEAKGALIRASVDDDPETGRLAVEALGKIGAPLAEVRRALTALESDEADLRLAPALFRFPGEGLVEAARALLASPRSEVREGAAYALGRVAPPEAIGPLRALAVAPESRLRAIAARGLGEIGGPEDLALLEGLLDDVEPSPRIQALRAGARILGRVAALPPLGWGERLTRLVGDPLPGIRATALESAWPWLGQEELRRTVERVAAEGEPRERELALLALARAGAEGAEALVRRAALDPDRFLRARAAEGAALLGLSDVVEALAGDPQATVRVAAAAARLDEASDDALPGLARSLLADPDLAVRTTALDALVERPLLAGDELARAFEAAATDRGNDVRLAAVRALSARGAWPSAPAAERGLIAETLRRIAADRDLLVRREVAAGLVALGDPRPAPVPLDTGRAGPVYALILDQTAGPRYVRLETSRGELVARLDCPQAPLTCLSFLQLAAQGYFDGTRFHRVVPDFVVQGGDPRGDGWGGPGFALRDEINRLRYDRGAVGMALSGPDSGGSQFFVTLAPQPHLDGGFTVFGHVVVGDAVLDQIRQGDLLTRVSEISWSE